MTIELPMEKKEKISEQLHKFSTITRCSIRDFAKLVGTLGSCCAALKFGWVHMKDFEREKFSALQRNKDNYEVCMELNDEIKEYFDWWKSHIATAKCSIKSFEPALEIFSDALSGWDVLCQGQRAHGYWNKEEKKCHINYLELLSTFFGLKCFAEKVRSSDILLRIDNTTAIAYINKIDGIRFKKLSKLAKQI
ncbi:reverse transcriptase and recombinase [Lasius niger]|uniref:Reverse transcriptase and recombinase n=1 Tax=Lasius niger TaxID=67767 RepID=A0A0J7MRF1_LASNI|nr:reverse transcriptase and recombinase [Lasius niger]